MSQCFYFLVKLLPTKIKVGGLHYKVHKMEIEVKYDHVDEKVSEIWSLNPSLVIHVGVHGGSDKIRLEKCATNEFPSPDYAAKILCAPQICLENSGVCSILHTQIDVDKITSDLNANYKNMFEASCDVGKYLCGYIYLKSLDKSSSQTLFIHVPCIDKPFTTKETSDAILKVIEKCLAANNL